MARAESGKRVMGWAAAAALLAATPLLAACSGDSDSSSDDAKPSASGSQSPSAPSSPSAGDSNGSDAKTGGRPTMSEAVSTWVGAVIEKDTKKACLVSAIPGKGSAPAQGATPEKCDAATLKKLAVGVKAMGKAFTPPDASGKPTVKVNAPEPKKDKVLVPSAQIMVDGKPLRQIILDASKGVNPKSFSAKVEAEKLDGKWYVGDFDLNAGSGNHHPQGH
ncbi:hypothetical protein AB0I22_39365 [Streptomyces sp. NPDC050610]|uniref:hypothetical protein n=1 Tax=Streptomyces sp. NPDC050610 TaxID=3157097 RepID=UPI00344AEB56